MKHVKEHIMELVGRSSESTLEEILLGCQGLTWNQVFIELDRMSRSGEIRLTLTGRGRYGVSRPTTCPLHRSGGPQDTQAAREDCLV